MVSQSDILSPASKNQYGAEHPLLHETEHANIYNTASKAGTCFIGVF